jgi:hypothetical protein
MSRIVIVILIYHRHKSTALTVSMYLGNRGDNWVTGSVEMDFPASCRHRRTGCPVFPEVTVSVAGRHRGSVTGYTVMARLVFTGAVTYCVVRYQHRGVCQVVRGGQRPGALLRDVFW